MMESEKKEQENRPEPALDASSSKGDKDRDADDSEGSDSEFEDQNDGAEVGNSNDPADRLALLRRQKRLAMNRESARARRKRKKVQLQTLEQQVAGLEKRNRQYQLANETLNAQVKQLENELQVARSTITVLSNRIHQDQRSNLYSPLDGLSIPGNNSSQDHLFKLLQAQSASLTQQGVLPIQLLDSSLLQQRVLDAQAQASREREIDSVLARRTPAMAALNVARGPPNQPGQHANMEGGFDPRLVAAPGATTASRLLGALSASTSYDQSQEKFKNMLEKRGY